MADLLERLIAQAMADPGGCWLWPGHRNRRGYGRYKGQQAHRVVYEEMVGPIPEGKCLDHRECDNPPCVNPAHLLPCTPIENTMRGCSPPAMNARKVTCQHGHPFDETNTYRIGRRRCCRNCNRMAAAKYKRKKASLSTTSETAHD